MNPCKHCRGTGAIWCQYIGTWEPCGCAEWDDAEDDDGPDADDARDRRIDEELMGYDDDRRDDDANQ
jgi:hypothetical protein